MEGRLFSALYRHQRRNLVISFANCFCLLERPLRTDGRKSFISFAIILPSLLISTESEQGGFPIITVNGGSESFLALRCSFRKNVETTSFAPPSMRVCLKVESLNVFVRTTSISVLSVMSNMEMR